MDYSRTSTYDYELPAELVADTPAPTRSSSRLMTKGEVAIEHHRFHELPDLLQPGDLVVFNDVKVVPARIHARKETGGAVELFVVDVIEPHGDRRWQEPADVVQLRCMTRSSKPVRAGQVLSVGEFQVAVLSAEPGYATISIKAGGRSAAAVLSELGEVPLPPYIVRRRGELGTSGLVDDDRERYQTVYARAPGAVAAPTAGLHFDVALLDALDARGVQRASITLDVGPGTFRPVTAERLDDHEMHFESYEISATLGDAIARTRATGGRVVAVGTTTVRTLEAEARLTDPFVPGRRETNLFIRPGFEFRVVDAMITNFHLPRSTLLALVYAFGGAEVVRQMYEVAVAEQYRFYSYGDAMLLRRGG